MSDAKPQVLLFSEAQRFTAGSKWRFVVQHTDGREVLDITDVEPNAKGERLELLAVIRGLESLDAPSKVTLVTTSDYVKRGIQYGIAQWRADEWRWERFGLIVPIKNQDLWQRLDRALAYHEIDCHRWRVDAADENLPAKKSQLNADTQRASLADRISRAVGACFPLPQPALAG
jgi:ribonuclease HI